MTADKKSKEAAPVLDAEGAARLLHVSTKTVLKLARAGEIPGMKVGREWRFARVALIEHVAGAVMP